MRTEATHPSHMNSWTFLSADYFMKATVPSHTHTHTQPRTHEHTHTTHARTHTHTLKSPYVPSFSFRLRTQSVWEAERLAVSEFFLWHCNHEDIPIQSKNFGDVTTCRRSDVPTDLNIQLPPLQKPHLANILLGNAAWRHDATNTNSCIAAERVTKNPVLFNETKLT